MELQSYAFDDLPKYLKDYIDFSTSETTSEDAIQAVQVLDVQAITQLDSPALRYRHLLLKRHALTDQIAKTGLCPPLVYERALTYELLGFADLAAADAFVAYALCESVRSDEWISDLEPIQLSGEPWNSSEDGNINLISLCNALAVLCRSLVQLGATEDANEKFSELTARYGELIEWDGDKDELMNQTADFVNASATISGKRASTFEIEQTTRYKFGWARREIYPWNEHEPDRNGPGSISEISSMLSQVAPNLTVKVTALPALNESGSLSAGTWYQLGLFAAKDLSPGSQILQEKSLLTAIRPLDASLCDACGADLERVSRESLRECPAFGCDATYCSEDCAARAAAEYHPPYLHEDTDNSDTDISVGGEQKGDETNRPSSQARFCGNTELEEIGRISSTTTAEWDLYFLLMTRTVQLSTTQRIHPLSLPSTKYLWGDFNPPHSPLLTTTANPDTLPKKTLPWSLHHNLTLPLQYFETLMDSDPAMTPYSPHWLAHHDWWIQSTLQAKFRGVANAQQSTFDGKAEVAAVHPLWCLANHSCAPNVTWSPTGERVFRVRERGELVGARDVADGDGTADGTEWTGIKEGEEIWSHYTDVRLPVEERRERLLEVLGGVCKCPRCMREAGNV